MSAKLLSCTVSKQVNLVSGQLCLALSLYPVRNLIRIHLDLFSGLQIVLQLSRAREQKL